MFGLLITVAAFVFVAAQYTVYKQNTAVNCWGLRGSASNSARSTRTVALLAMIGLIIVRGPYMDWKEDYTAHQEALYENTKWISTDSGMERMCNRCEHTVFDPSFTEWNDGYANGHTVSTNPMWYEEPHKYSKYVRTCSSR